MSTEQHWRERREQRSYLWPTESQPDIHELSLWVMDGECESTDGCMVEPDGECEHGHVSWLRYLGMI